MNNRNKFLLIGLTAVAIAFSSCLGPKTISLNPELKENNCYQSYYYKNQPAPKPTYTIEIDSLVTQQLSCKSINVANAIGLLPSIVEYVRLKNTNLNEIPISTRLELVEKATSINQRISTASLEVLSFTSDINCEEVHITQIAEYLKGIENKNEAKLTISAIVVGGIGTIATGFTVLKGIEGNVTDYIGITTGIAETALGLMALRNSKTVEVLHAKNILQEVWEGNETSLLFPQSIWYYLNFSNPTCETKGSSIRQHIINEWKSLDQITDTNAEEHKSSEIYFGPGGDYDLAQLENRANMLSHLKAHINQMKHEINLLALEFAQIAY